MSEITTPTITKEEAGARLREAMHLVGEAGRLCIGVECHTQGMDSEQVSRLRVWRRNGADLYNALERLADELLND